MDDILVSVCIATYKRAELLKKLIDSLSFQKLNDDIKFEIIVVDNDKSASASEVVDKYKETVNFNLKYFIQPVKNISLTRNMAV